MKYLNFLLAALMAIAARGAEIKSWGGTATDAFLNQAPSALNIYRSGSSNLVTISWLTVANPISGSVTGASGSSPAGSLTGTTLAAGVVNSSLTSVGTLANLTVTAPISGNLSGNATTATALQTGRNINGVFFNGTANITVPVAGSDITGVVAIANGGTGQTTARAAIDALSVKGADVASATTTDLSATTGDFVDVTGTTTITGLGTAASGVERTVRFTGILTLTHNATSLILPGSANITTVGGDRAIFRSLGSGNWLCVDFIPSTITGSGPTVLANNPIFTTGIQVASETISGTGGAGFTQYPAQSSAPSSPVGGFREYADASGRLSWIRASDGFTRTFDATLTANRIYTLPDASITFARTDATQTFTGDQIFATITVPTITAGVAGETLTLNGGTSAAAAGSAGGPVAIVGRAGTTTGSGGAGGAVSVVGGAAGGDNTVNRVGGSITLTSGASKGDSTGGDLTATAGTGGSGTAATAAVGGQFSFTAGTGGIGSTTGGNGGAVFVTGGSAGTGGTTPGNGGAISIRGGSGSAQAGSGGGAATITGRDGTTTGTGGAGGNVSVLAGSGQGDGTVNRAGGNVTVTAGASKGSSVGGTSTILGGIGGIGTGATGAAGGAVTVQGGAGGANATTSGAGGSVAINGGLGGSSGTPGSGGAITFSTAVTTSRLEHMRITAGGNVGIDTTAPDKKLEINLGTSDSLRLTYNDNNGSASVFADYTVSSGGILGINATGANIRQGADDAASPVAQTSSVQSVVAGTSNTAGVTRTYAASASTGTGAGGSHVFTVTPAGSTGTSQNAQVTAVTIASTLNTTFAGPVIMKGYTVATLPTPAVQGMFVYVTDATAPTYGATVAGGGAVVTPVFYDGTNWTAR